MKTSFISKAFLALTLLSFGTTACDDGLVNESSKSDSDDDVRTASVEGTFSGWDGWDDGYSVVLAGFEEDNAYAVISKPITASEGGITLSQIPVSVTTVSLCVINRLRQRVATFEEWEFPASENTLSENVGTMNVSMYHCIQQTVFNTTCAHCHGGSGYAASGLNLTEGNSYSALVNHASKKVSGETLVIPSDADNSLLTRVLGSTLTGTWGYDHSKEVIDSNVLTLIESWINQGAKE